jgi:hypothetical protein
MENTPIGVFDKVSELVHYVRKNLHIIEAEISRWRDILVVPYQLYVNA